MLKLINTYLRKSTALAGKIVLPAVLSIIFATVPVSHAFAEKLYLNADSYKEKLKSGTVFLDGNAMAKTTDTILNSDTIKYNKKTKVLEATGDIVLKEITVNRTTYASYIKTNKALSKGKINDAKQNMNDELFIEAKCIILHPDSSISADDAVYTSCNPEKDESRAWQLHASSITSDPEEESLFLTNVWMKMWGIPVFYWPTMVQPLPSVIRRSGFLNPTIASQSKIGLYIKLPYYYPVSDTQDLTFTPTLTTTIIKDIFAGESIKSSAFKLNTLELQYRKEFADASFDINAASEENSDIEYTEDPDSKRYVVNANYNQSLRNHWNISASTTVASHKDFLKEYQYLGYHTETNFKNFLKLDNYTRTSYLSAEIINYRDLTATTSPYTTISPQLYYTTTTGDSQTGFLNLTLKSRNYKKHNDKESQMSTLLAHYKYPIHIKGLLLVPALNVQADNYSYNYNQKIIIDGTTYEQGVAQRLFTKFSLYTSYPLMATNAQRTFVIEPISGIFLNNDYKDKEQIPNFDSDTFELDESSLFQPTRYAGSDRIDYEKRFVYGVKSKYWGKNALRINAFLGQSISLDDVKKSSNYIGNFYIYGSGRGLQSNFEIDSQTNRLRKLETSGNITLNPITITAGYNRTDPEDTTLTQNIDQGNATIAYAITPSWNISVNSVYNFLETNKGIVKKMGSITYTTSCKCLTILSTYTENYDKNLILDKIFYISLTFKSLGNFETSQDLLAPLSTKITTPTKAGS